MCGDICFVAGLVYNQKPIHTAVGRSGQTIPSLCLQQRNVQRTPPANRTDRPNWPASAQHSVLAGRHSVCADRQRSAQRTWRRLHHPHLQVASIAFHQSVTSQHSLDAGHSSVSGS